MNYTFDGRMAALRIWIQVRRRSRMLGIRWCGLVVTVTRRGLAQGLKVC
jgi:hypothetical protein